MAETSLLQADEVYGLYIGYLPVSDSIWEGMILYGIFYTKQDALEYLRRNGFSWAEGYNLFINDFHKKYAAIAPINSYKYE